MTGGSFNGELVLRNYPVWALGLMAIVIRDLDDNLLQVGFGKSRGFGFVSASAEDLQLSVYPARSCEGKFPGVLTLSKKDLGADGENGGAVKAADLADLPEGVEERSEWCRTSFSLDKTQAWQFLSSCVEGALGALAQHGATGGERG